MFLEYEAWKRWGIMTAIARIVLKRSWISVFLFELFGAGFVLTLVALLLASGRMRLFILGGACICFAVGFVLLAPPIDHKLREKEALFKMIATMPLWLALALILIEVILHLTLYSSPLQFTPGGYMGQNPVAGSVLVSGKEGYGITHYGVGGEIAGPSDSSPGIDVIVLGDSLTEAMQVMDSEKYTEVAERILKQSGLPVHVHNFGTSGACPSDYTYFVENVGKIVPRLEPKIIVIQLSTNDENDDPFVETRNNYFSADADGSFSVNHNDEIGNAEETKVRQIARASSIVKLIRNRYLPGRAPRTTMDVSFDRQLEALRKATAGYPVIMLPLPDEPIIQNDSLTFEDKDYEQLRDRLKAVPEWQVIDPLPEFINITLQGHLPRGFTNTLPGTGHMNVWGHEIVGKLLAQKILEMEKPQ